MAYILAFMFVAFAGIVTPLKGIEFPGYYGGLGRINDTANSTVKLTLDILNDSGNSETRTGGIAQIDKFAGYFIYVPKSCVGSVKCPLVIALHDVAKSGGEEVYRLRPMADKYGMIVLGPNSVNPGRWDLLREISATRVKLIGNDAGVSVDNFISSDMPRLDSALKFIVSNYSIDRDRIALIGASEGGGYALFLGLNNLHVFSRVVSLSPSIPFSVPALGKYQSQVFLSGGIDEDSMVRWTLDKASQIRKQGYHVRSNLGLRTDKEINQDDILVWKWLKESWDNSVATPNNSDDIDTYVVLTENIINKVDQFQTRYKSPRNSVFGSIRAKYPKQIELLIGSEQVFVTMTDIEAMALDKFSSIVPNTLKDLGVTAKEMMDYRKALVAVEIAHRAGMYVSNDTKKIGTSKYFKAIDPNSTLGKNLMFLNSHKELFKDLERKDFWRQP